VAAMAEAGVRWIQLRAKNLSVDEIRQMAQEIVPITKRCVYESKM